MKPATITEEVVMTVALERARRNGISTVITAGEFLTTAIVSLAAVDDDETATILRLWADCLDGDNDAGDRAISRIESMAAQFHLRKEKPQ